MRRTSNGWHMIGWRKAYTTVQDAINRLEADGWYLATMRGSQTV